MRLEVANWFLRLQNGLVLAHPQWVKAFIVGSALGFGPLRDSKRRMSPDRPDGEQTLSRILYLVDPASSHMLVPKTKPCMSELKP